MQPPPAEARRDAAQDTQWSRPECQAWTGALLLGTCLLYCARVSMPVCSVSMSQDFGWNKKEAGIVLSSFFWGYCLTQVVGGHLGDRIGGEKVILLSASAWGLITAATPLLAHLGSTHLVFMTFSRILTGLLQGVYFPALTSLLSQKVRESERAFTYSTVGAGSQFGTLVTGAVGSLLLDWYGWQSVFYFSGGLTLLWVCYVYRYLLSEQDLLLALGVLAQGLPTSRHTKVPWRQLFRKPSVWAVVFSQLSSACSFFILLSWLPTFFKETFPSSKGWVFNVVPWLVAIPASLFSGFLSDHLINQGYRTITVRKFMQVMGLGLSGVFALCLGHTSSFCKSVVFASASIGLQTFNHRCGQHSWGLGRCRGRVPGRLPDRDHRLLDICVQPGGRHQQPGAVHLPGVRTGPACGPESPPRGPLVSRTPQAPRPSAISRGAKGSAEERLALYPRCVSRGESEPQLGRRGVPTPEPDSPARASVSPLAGGAIMPSSQGWWDCQG
ncbi:voltage-gated purine nucleotide uniporter SLC17A9 isoform X1 [Diceros bicornis minor]|uniref:voltage-gated purine nucleotide uniporter SLC17A9 isoform X1 n=1 Tax=Diceros bicornis minor TaxID=77932 RepID=UPI0026ED1B52|nr:voltage-gated purine nucleotide uniporter SLC17A9 isoform X1 [Diceros bicornis minor]